MACSKYKNILLNEITDVVLIETQKLNKGVLSESAKQSTILMCENMRIDLRGYIEENEGLKSKAIREAIIKIDLYERLGIYNSNKGLKMLFECIDNIENEFGLIVEDYAPAYVNTAYKGVDNYTDNNYNIGKDYAISAGILGGIEAAKHGYGYTKAAINGTKYVPKSTAGQSLMFGAGKKLTNQTAKVMEKGGKLTIKGMSKLFEFLGKWFPKLAKLAPKVASMGSKAARAAAVGATLGAWLIVEAVLAIISYGGKKFIESDNKASYWCIKKLISFYEKGGKLAAIVDAVWQFFGYADIKNLVLTRGIQLGYITPEEANKIEQSSSLFGSYFANDFSNVQYGDVGAEQQQQQIYQQDAYSQWKQTAVQNIPVNQAAQQTSAAGTPTIQQIFKEIAPLSDRNGWLANARRLGWPEEKIQAYRTVINNYYKNKQISETNKKDMDNRNNINELSWGNAAGKTGKAAQKVTSRGNRFVRPNRVINNATNIGDDAARWMERLGNTAPRKIENKSSKLIALFDKEVKAAEAVTKQADNVINQLNKNGVEALAKAGVNVTDMTKIAFKQGTDGMIIALDKASGKSLAKLSPKHLKNILSEFKKADKQLADEITKLDKERKLLANARRETTKLAKQEKAAQLASLNSQIEHCNQAISRANTLKSKNARIMASIAAVLGVGAGFDAGFGAGNAYASNQNGGDMTPQRSVQTQVQVPGMPADFGRNSENVKIAQRYLVANRVNISTTKSVDGIDGILGPRTKKAILAYMTQYNCDFAKFWADAQEYAATKQNVNNLKMQNLQNIANQANNMHINNPSQQVQQQAVNEIKSAFNSWMERINNATILQ